MSFGRLGAMGRGFGHLGASLGRAGVPVLPTGNLVARYISSQGVTITGSGVSQWNDIVGTNHLTQGTDANRMTNPTTSEGFSVVRAGPPGSTTFLNIPSSLSFNNRALSAFVVCRRFNSLTPGQPGNPQAAGPGNSALIGGGTAGTNSLLWFSGNNPATRDSANLISTATYGYQRLLIGEILGASTISVIQGNETASQAVGTSNTTTGGLLNEWSTGQSLVSAGIDYYEIVIYAEAVSAPKLAQIQAYYNAVYGVQIVKDTSMVVDGDSQTVGLNLTDLLYQGWAYQLVKSAKYQPKLLNFAVPSQTLATCTTQAVAANGVDSIVSAQSGFTNKIVIIDALTNDLQVEGVSTATAISRAQAYHAARISAGWSQCWHVPIRPRGTSTNTTYEAARQTVNAALAADPTIGPFFLSSLLSHPIWSATDATNATWYQGDNIHMTAAAHAVQGSMIYTVFKSAGLMA